MTGIIPSIEQAKTQAKALRAALMAEGREITHAQALELVAKTHGYKDWNTLCGLAGNRPRPPALLGQIVEGRYLDQPFLGEVVGLRELSEGRYEIELHLDEPVDVVTFDSFSNFRRRIRKVVGPSGRSFDTTSDGKPHLVLMQ